MLILGLGNKARHGKDSFATAVEIYYGKLNSAAMKHGLRSTPVIVQRTAFADALYAEVNEALKAEGIESVIRGIHENFVNSDWVIADPKPEISSRAPYGKHPKLLQWWGSEFRRAQDPAYWVKKFVAGINPKADIVLVTDMRFINEADAIKKIGGYAVQVNRLNVDGTPFVDTARPANHVSEIQLDDYNFDHKITVKTGDLVLLEEWAITLVHYLRAKGHK